VISPTLTVVKAKFRHQHPSSLHSNFHSIFCRELGAFFAGKAFGDLVALTFESEARGRSPIECPPKLLPPRA
jgi:hypothetical protein